MATSAPNRGGVQQTSIAHYWRLYVGNLGPTVTPEQLTALFRSSGKVLSVNVIRSSPNRTFAFIEVDSEDSAKQAIAQYHGIELAGSPMVVYRVPPRSRPKRS